MFFRRLNGKYEIDATLRPIVAGCPARFEFLTTDYPKVPAGYKANYDKYFKRKDYKASGITINNGIEYPVILGDLSDGNTVASFGPVTDLGKNNTVSQHGSRKY